jgi:hypothetical protein
LFEKLFALTDSDNERTQISAISELLDRLIGKPQVTIDAVTTKVDVGALYLAAMKRANAEIVPGTSHILPSEPSQTIDGEGKPCSTGTSENYTIG